MSGNSPTLADPLDRRPGDAPRAASLTKCRAPGHEVRHRHGGTYAIPERDRRPDCGNLSSRGSRDLVSDKTPHHVFVEKKPPVA